MQKDYRLYRTRRRLDDSVVLAGEYWWQVIGFVGGIGGFYCFYAFSGILLIAELLKCLATKKLDHGTIHSLIGFFTDRLADWQALHGALVGFLALLRRKGNVGVVIDSDTKSLAQSFMQNIQVRALGKDDRKLAFSSTPLYEPFVVPMLLEKLSSSLPAAKVDSLRYLSNCIVKYGTDIREKHSTTIWLSLKEAIFTSSPKEPIFSGLSELDGEKIHESEIAKEAQICLQKFIFQVDGSVLGLIFGDKEIDMILSSIVSSKSYNNISKESKKQLHALGSILSRRHLVMLA